MIVDLTKSWIGEDMACLKKNPEMFFGDYSQGTLTNPTAKVQAKWNRAKAVCRTCPVMRECARDNLGEMEGVWGGLDPAERIALRAAHNVQVRAMTGPRKEEYAKLAYDLRTARNHPFGEIGRVLGLGGQTAQYLYEWWAAHLKSQKADDAKVVDLALPVEVTEIGTNAQFPDLPPKNGDCWARYGRRVIYGYYLGQTSNDEWYCLRVRLLGTEYSIAWFKAEDVKLTRNVARTVMNRVGKGSRIYGTALSKGYRRGSQAG